MNIRIAIVLLMGHLFIEALSCEIASTVGSSKVQNGNFGGNLVNHKPNGWIS